MQYSTEGQQLLRCAASNARSMGHSYVGTSHLLLALLQRPGLAGQLLRGVGMDGNMTRNLTCILYGTGAPDLPLPQGFSQQARRVLRCAGTEARNWKKKRVEGIHILLSVLRCEKTAAKELLVISGVDTEELFSRTVEYLHWQYEKPVQNKKEAVTTKLLEQFSVDDARRELRLQGQHTHLYNCLQSK